MTTPAMPEQLLKQADRQENLSCNAAVAHESAQLMRKAAQALATLQAQPAEVSDADIAHAVRSLYTNDEAAKMGLPDDIKTARAVLALRPQAVPMTDEQFTQLLRKLKRSREVFQAGRDSYETACAPMNSDDEAWSAYLAHHGITAPAGGEKQA